MAMVNHLRTSISRTSALAAILALALPLNAYASADPMIEGARQCTQYFPAEEQKNAIPAHLLAAIASTESGRWHNGMGLALPWPWTINVEGKGYYFDTKAQAIAKVAALQRQGVRSIDVGCMQVSLLHHPMPSPTSTKRSIPPPTSRMVQNSSARITTICTIG